MPFCPEPTIRPPAPGPAPTASTRTSTSFNRGGSITRTNRAELQRARRTGLAVWLLYGEFLQGRHGGALPSDQFDPHADYGRASFDVRNRFLVGGNLQGPFGVSLSPFMVVNSGTPFNITIGQDLNGDNQYNDRPAYATAGSTDTLSTSFGTFDLDPGANERRSPSTWATVRRSSA